MKNPDKETRMTTTRTDIHRPSFLDPAEYEEVGYFDLHPEDGGGSIDEEYADKDAFLGNFAARGRCDHCGAGPLRYIVLFSHKPTDTIVTVGTTCAGKLGLSSLTEYQIRQRVQAEARDEARRVKYEAFAAECPDIVAFLDALMVEEHEYREAMEKANDEFEIAYEAAYLAGERTPTFRGPKAPAGGHPFLFDMVHALARWGSLTEKQIEVTRKFIANAEKFAAAKAEREANEVKPEAPIAEGRRVITGKIVHTKFVDNDFGGALKMLVVETDGNKVWGTVPGSLSDETAGQYDSETHTYGEAIDLVGLEIEFKGTVERSKDDEHFGFYKRPSNTTWKVAGA